MTTKELLTVEFRFRDKPNSDTNYAYRNKIITIGLFDTLEQAMYEGNKVLDVLSESFEVRTDDKFMLEHSFGRSRRLVTNTCYPTSGVEYFAKITQMEFSDLNDAISETFAASNRYKEYTQSSID